MTDSDFRSEYMCVHVIPRIYVFICVCRGCRDYWHTRFVAAQGLLRLEKEGRSVHRPEVPSLPSFQEWS